MKVRIFSALILGSISTTIISLALMIVNYGIKPGFFKIWLRSWPIAFVLAFLLILFIVPYVQVWIASITKEGSKETSQRSECGREQDS